MFRRTLLASAMSAAIMLPAAAHHAGDAFGLEGVSVSHAHTVEVAAMSHSIDVFLTIENTSDQAVTLIGAEVDFARPGVFQAPVVDESGKMSVREISAIEIAPGQSVTMQPGGVHIVFDDVQRAFEGGDNFHAHLQFEGLGELEVEVEVEHADEDHQREHGETG